ncbi:RecQ family zinc-binding domain-containing protein, partial [Halomonas sp. BM-2019]|uniref:RecQ family zinc-binding domain-containing protein n=1 Tax=Halomonas sp. BM-2019 TaxID=2811227 RepID=UPI001B3C3750
EALVGRFAGERGAFVQALLDAAPRARTWHALDFATLARLGAERGLDVRRTRVLTALEYFVDKGWMTLESKQLTEVYRVLEAPRDPAALADALHAYFRDKEQAEVARLHAMLALFEADDCLTRRLAEWFGDTRAPAHCGHCSACRGEPARLPAPTSLAPLESQDIAARLAALGPRLAEDSDGGPATADLLARFLCGIATPRLTRLKARRLPGFGALAAYPYAEVRESAAALAAA